MIVQVGWFELVLGLRWVLYFRLPMGFAAAWGGGCGFITGYGICCHGRCVALGVRAWWCCICRFLGCLSGVFGILTCLWII